MLAGLQRDAFVAHLYKGFNFSTDFVLAEFLARNSLVLGMIGTIDAPVDAVVGQVQWGEHHDAVAVEALFHLAGQLLVTLNQVGLVTVEKHRGFAVGQALAPGCLFYDFLNKGTVALILLSVG